MITMNARKSTAKKNHEQALAKFMSRTQACRDLVEKITTHLDDHMNVEPENVNWAHVGDVAHIQMLLEQICDFARINTAGVDRITPVEE